MIDTGSRAWIGRAAFEAGLIVFGLVGALLVDEWRDTRQREARRDAALASVREELRANRESLDGAIANHETVMGRLRESVKTGVRYEGSIMNAPQLSTVAWQAARDAAVTADIEHATLMAIGHAYRALDQHGAERMVFLNFLYTGGSDLRDNPRGLGGWLSDLALHARGVQKRIDGALQALGPAQSAD